MSKEDFIPAGFAPLAQWDYRSREKKDGHSPEYMLLRAAADAGEIRGFQASGSKRRYVNEGDAAELLKSQASQSKASLPSNAQKPCERQYESACESLADIASGVGFVVQLLERLATAVESIATQPKTPQQEMLQTMDSNGFYS